jgi:hypothetical protein
LLKELALQTGARGYEYDIGGCPFIGLRDIPPPPCATSRRRPARPTTNPPSPLY